MKIMLAMLVAGLIAGGSGLYLLMFTDIANDHGFQGLMLVVLLITLGLVFLIPAKVYIILKLMKVKFGKSSKEGS